MKNEKNKAVYEDPRFEVVSFDANDVISASTEGFFGEEDPLSNE